jgi:dolichol-phosphate mannosyltransferase
MSFLEETQLKEIRSQFEADWEVPEFRIDFWDGKSSDYCVIVPVINEGDRIRQFVKRLKENKIETIADIIIVDGGSSDGSLDHCFLRSQGVRGLITKTGAGRLSAQLRVGYSFGLACSFNGLVTIDGNNKDDPSPIPDFIRHLGDGYDFVQASRFVVGGKEENTPASRHRAIRWIHAPMLRLASGFRWTDTTQGFRAYSRRLLLSQRLFIFRSVFSSYELLAYLSYASPILGFECIELPSTRCYPRGEVPSKISSVRGNLDVFLTLVKACLGIYGPRGVGMRVDKSPSA